VGILKRARVYGPGCPCAPRPRRYQPAVSLDGTEHAQSASGDTLLTNTSDARMKPPSRPRPHRLMLPTPRHIWASLQRRCPAQCGCRRSEAATYTSRRVVLRAAPACWLLCAACCTLHPAPSTQQPPSAVEWQPRPETSERTAYGTTYIPVDKYEYIIY
jgi:hypothetical protein